MFKLLKKLKKKRALIKKHDSMLLGYARMWHPDWNHNWNDYVHRMMMAEQKAIDKLRSL